MFNQQTNVNTEMSYLERLESDFLSAKLTKRLYLMKVNKELRGLIA
jgi:hypothetical protein